MSNVGNPQSNESASTRERRLAALVNTTTDAIIMVDHLHYVTFANKAAEQVFGYAADTLMHAHISKLIPMRFHAAHAEHIEHFSKTGQSVRRMGGEANVVGVRASGEEFPIDASISHVIEDDQHYFTIILRDITTRKQMLRQLEASQESLRALYDGMQDVREQERKRIARELHDDLGQMLAALRIDLMLLRGELPQDRNDLLNRVTGIDELLYTAITAVRRISADLRPRPLDDLGLPAALTLLSEEISRRYGLTIRVALPPDEMTIPDEIASPIYRMVQESLNNIVKHAQAKIVSVELTHQSGSLAVSVRDDGVGMDPALAPSSDSFGLVGMRERAMAMGGTVTVESVTGQGTRIGIVVPL
ncbi:MAG: PAS domain S-box protein [Rhodocyclaceae bacterium]|nr:PAS domain S-box protein [Rhodocyclaceae bacterium]